MEKTGIREPLNSPIPHPDPLDSAIHPSRTLTRSTLRPGGPATGGRLEAELGYGMPVGGRLVGMPSFGIGASGHGRDYRLGYGLTVAQGGATHFDLGVYANRRESLGQGTAEHGVGGQLTARW